MAIHRKLKEGSILFTFHTPHYHYYYHRTNRPKYAIQFQLLYVYNRRERSSGVTVPVSMKPTLEKLGIRMRDTGNPQTVYAVGCRYHMYHECPSDYPYPTPEEVQIAQEKLTRFMQSEKQVNGIVLEEIEFMKEFKEKKMSNKDSVFSLLQPLKQYMAKETYYSY